MALADILAAITAQADQKITDARSVHQKNLTKIREFGERTVASKKQEIAVQKEKLKAQLKAKTQTHAAMQMKNAELRKKREILDRIYSEVVEELSSLPDEELKPLFTLCLKSITAKGTIHPAQKHVKLIKELADHGQFDMGSTVKAKGGFTFTSQKQEQDCTLEHLVHEVLRPKSELEIAQMLFPKE